MIFTTHYYLSNGTKWSGPRLNCLCWSHAEFMAFIKGVEVTGRLRAEIDEETGVRIDYDLPQLN
ncbi:hypothetical protein [Pedobacter sp. B4-66]|uniref:hypothetical protein n=1 Tax=Pedobacter sp. B4-66 TaxID=2817280 RepID=UPI001BDA71D3|nr:hypothetical protein [Pedobacter sp. B4-66]